MADAERYDALIIGAGMSGLAAGIRLAQFDRRVAILERHYLWGGLNSFYKLAGRRFDVGLHALTNYVPPRTRGAPLTRVLKQLRIRHDELRLGEHRCSEILFPGTRLRFSNDLALLEEEIAAAFPGAVDAFARLVEEVRAYDIDAAELDQRSSRQVLCEILGEPFLAEMLLLPPLFYGSPHEEDMDWASYCILFRSIFLEGLSRPEGGIRPVLNLLLERFRDLGGELRMKNGVSEVRAPKGRVEGVVLDDGTELAADLVLSSAGYAETMRLTGTEIPPADVGRMSFLESISVLDRTPEELGHEAATSFYSNTDRALYRVPPSLADVRSGVISAPNNFASEEPLPEGILRVTVPANHGLWKELPDGRYVEEKNRIADEAVGAVSAHLADWRPHTVFRDVFTPRTIERFTGHFHGAVYGSLQKRRDGSTGIDGLVLCGTDQGYLGVVGSMVSGITMANLHGLREAAAS
ncbi:MAG: NAD(P)/FAD-dependent oxidoreductase [Planctomycetota bacterium]